MKVIFELILGLALILIGATFFTNGIEWLGKRLNLSQSAVGSILAAVGTALPESIIPIIAVFFGTGDAGQHIGIGAILGAPFMLATLGLTIIGLSALACRRRRQTGSMVVVNRFQMQRDMGFFLLFFSLAVAGAFLPTGGKYAVALILVLGYSIYVRWTIQGECEAIGECEPLYLARKKPKPGLGIIIFQVVLSLALIISGAESFVAGVEAVATWIGLSPLIVAMILAPIATELPEKLNSIIWMRQSKDILATGNMTGAMVFQSSLLPAFGLVFTSWELGHIGLISAIMTILAGGLVWLANNRNHGQIAGKLLVVLSGFYLIFVYMVIQQL